MGVLFGLGAAVTWGSADYVAAIAGRRIGSHRVVLGFHVVATFLLALLVLGTGSLEGVSAADVGFFVLVGAIGWTGYACFYRALAIGPISVLSPIVSGYAMVTLLLAIILLDERLGVAAACAVVVSVFGIVLASSGLRHIFRVERVDAHGLLFALAAMVLIGAFVLGVSVKADDLGWLAPVFLARLFSTVFVFASLIKGGGWRFPDRSPRVLWAVVALALLDTAGYISFNLGTEHSDTAIVAAASAPYAVIPVIAGVMFFHERPTPTEWVGVGFVIAGLVLLGIAVG
ncbi:DMT family transporter [Gaiella sp.]|uniref:DMT family transporter n=1 Tax=Gaiella sp. TaxID=2663207 RepID=UPI003265A416